MVYYMVIYPLLKETAFQKKMAIDDLGKEIDSDSVIITSWLISHIHIHIYIIIYINRSVFYGVLYGDIFI